MKLRRFALEADWIEAGREEFLSALARARTRGAELLRLCLAGGTTPAPLYRALAAAPSAGLPVELWPGDEREVAADSSERNGKLVEDCFAAADWFPPPRLRPWPEGPAALAARSQDERLRAAGYYSAELFFDLSFLGIGADGHTAGLFADSPSGGALAEPGLAFPTFAPSEPRRRMSLGYGALASTRSLVFLLRGAGKRGLFEELESGAGRDDDTAWPALRLARLAAGRGAEVQLFYCEV